MGRGRACRTPGIQLLTRLRVVDNSVPGRTMAKCAQVNAIRGRMKVAGVGDKIKVACRGKMMNAIVTGIRGNNGIYCGGPPEMGENTCVLVDNNWEPMGTRIRGPLPAYLRSLGPRTVKICSLATRFV